MSGAPRTLEARQQCWNQKALSKLKAVPEGKINLLSATNGRALHTFTAVIEKCQETGLYVGYVPEFPGAHSQGATPDELDANLLEVVEMLLDDGTPKLETDFIGTQTLVVA